MKGFKIITSALVATAMTATMAVVPVWAFNYENEANSLYKLGMYKGINETWFDPDLGTPLDRQTGVVMLLRMFGQEDDAKSLTYEKANAILSKFRDSGAIADWAKKQVAYAVDKGYVKGYSEDSTFRPVNALNGKAYCSLILQQLGYNGEFQYDIAATKLNEVGGLTASQANIFNSDTVLIKDSLVGISYGALQAKYKRNGEKLIKELIKNGDVSVQKAKEAGFNYAEVVSVAAIGDVSVDIGVTPKLPTTVKATYDDGTKEDVKINWPKVDTSRAGEQTITGTIDGTSVKAKVKVIVVPDELSVRAVSAGNLKEVDIKFNRPVAKEDEATDKGNYDVDDNTVLNAELSDDKMTVTLLLKNALKQQADVEVTVDEEVGFDDDFELTIDNIKDVTIPSVVEVVAVGNALVKVTFDEPVQNATALSSYSIDGKLFGSSQPTLSDDAKTVSFNMTQRLSSGSHKLTVKNKISDYAGFYIEDNETRFTVSDDDTAPKAEIKSATQTKVVLSFSEEVEAPEPNEVHTNTGSRVEKIVLDEDKKTFTVYFSVDNALPAAGGRITIDDVTDFSGNTVDIKLTVTPDYDVKRPEYVGYIIENQKEIVLDFSEEVFSTYGKFKLTDEDNDEIKLSGAAYDKDDDGKYVKTKLVLKREDGNDFDSGKYKLTISDVTDLNPLKNEIVKVTVNISVDDKTPPAVSNVYVDVDDNQVYIKFNEDVDEKTATTYTNYYYTLSNISKKLDKDTMDIELLSDDQTVCITLPFGDDYDSDEIVLVNKISRIQVESVKDLKGNEMSAISIGSNDFKSDNSSAPKITSAVVTDKNKIVVAIKGSINANTLNPDDFYITAGKDSTGHDIVITAWDALYDSDDSEITLSVNADIESDGTYGGKALYLALEDADDVDTVNTFKQKLVLSSAIKVGEDFNPVANSITSSGYERGVGTVLFIELSENLNLNDGEPLNSTNLSQFRVKADGKTVAAKIYYYDADEKNISSTDVNETHARFKVVIDGDYTNDRVQVIFFEDYNATIADNAGNGLADFDFTDTVE